MHASFCVRAVWLILLSLMTVAPGAFSAVPTGTLQFITDVYGRNENAGDAALTVIRTGDTNTGCSVNWSVTGGTATGGSDFSPVSGTLSFAAGETFKNISLLITDDALVESNETVNLVLSGAVNATLGFPTNAVLTIFDNDVSNAPPASVVQFVTDVYGRNENTGDASLTVTRSGDTSNACSVSWSVTGGSASSPADYSPTSGTLNFAAFETFKNISLLIADDALVESNETVHLTLSNPGNTTIGFPSNAVLTIFDNDVSNAPPVIQFVASVFGRFENQTAPLNVERIGDTNVACSVQWAYTGGAAQPFSDFFGGSSIINFAAGQTIIALPISIIDDGVAEPDETAGFLLHSPVNATLGSPTAATLTIYDNDASNPPPASVVQFITDVYGRSENAGDASLTVTRSGDTSNACSVSWSVIGGSATAGTDYSPASGTLNFAAFETFKNISLLITDDALVESNETVHLTLSSPVNATIGFPSNAVLTIFDNDVSNPPPATVVQFITDVYGRSENAGDASLTVTRSGNTSNACSVNWSVTGGGASSPADYSPTSGTLNFAAFETFRNISLLIVDDLLVESNETVHLTLSGAVGATIGFPSNAVLTIFDNDVVPSAELEITKTASANSMPVGSNVVFNLTLRNNGPASVTNQLTVTEVIPPGFDYVGDNSAGTGAYYSFGLGQWVMPTGLVAGATQTVAITVRALTAGTYTNTASINVPGGLNDPNTNNNSSSAIVTVTNAPPPQADLQITKTASASRVEVGETVVFTLTLRNNGPGAVTNEFFNLLTVTDVVPPGFDHLDALSSNPTNYYSFGLGQWVFPTGLAAGVTETLAITLRANAAVVWTNRAVITVPSDVIDPNTTNNSSSVTGTNTQRQADLEITKTASTNFALVGQPVVFRLVLRNTGPDGVTNAFHVADVLPSGYSYLSNTASGGTAYSLGQGRWLFFNGIAANTTQTLDIATLAITNGVFTNTAVLEGLSPGVNDPNTNNNVSSAVVTNAFPLADLSVQKFLTASNVNVHVGDRVSFTILVSNAGPASVSNVLVLDAPMAGLPPVFAGLGTNVSFSFVSNTFIITNLAAGQSATMELRVDVTAAGLLTNFVAVSVPPGIADTNLANNASFAHVNSALAADLQVTKTVSTDVVLSGQNVVFTITLRNNGPNTSTNTVVQDLLPPGLVLVSSNVPAGTAFVPGTGQWTVPLLAMNEFRVLQLTVRHPTGTTVTNTALILNSPLDDPTPLDRTSSVVAVWLTVNHADIAVSITLATNVVTLGQTTQVSFAVQNIGLDPASNITVSVPLPPGVEVVGVPANPDWNYNTNTAVWTRTNAMPSGALTAFTYDVRVTNAGLKTLTATRTGSQPTDPIPSNNTFSTNFVAGPVATITGLVKCATNGPALPGVTITATTVGGPVRQTVTRPDGTFGFTNLPAGTYTLTPTTNGYLFMPASQTVTAPGGVTNLPLFVALPRSINGTVRTGPNGSVLSGVTVQLSGAATATLLTDANGFFNFTSLNPGNYTVTPLTNALPFARFSPTNAHFVIGQPTNCLCACTNSATFLITNDVVVLRALELVQVSQDWENSLPLVARKDTLVRAHLQLLGTNTAPVDVRGARLLATNLDSGATANWPPMNRSVIVLSNNAAYAPLRSNITTTLNFLLADPWRAGRIEYRFEWTNGVLVPREPAEAGGTGSNAAVRVAYTNMPDLGVRFVKVAWTNNAGVTNMPTDAQIDEERARVVSIYPIVQFAALNGYFFWSRTNGAPTNEMNLVYAIDAARLTSTDTNGTSTNRIWYGVVANRVNRGLGFIGYPAAEGNISTSPNNYQRHLAAHEIGHTLGRNHAMHIRFGLGGGEKHGRCNEVGSTNAPDFPMVHVPLHGDLMPVLGPMNDDNKFIWGYDHKQGQVISPHYSYDLMSYCHSYASMTPWPWMSKYTYTNIFNYIVNAFGIGGAPQPALHHLAKNSSPTMLIRGQIDLQADSVTFQPSYPVVAGTVPMPEPGDYLLRVVDGIGQALVEVPFTPNVPQGEFGDVPSFAPFNIPVPVLASAAGAILFHNGLPIGTISASANAPVAQLISPNGGEVFGNSGIPASWFGSDPDGDQLHYLLQFSADGGLQWTTIAIDWDGTTLQIPPDVLAATSQGKLRVIASDGFRFTSDESDGEFVILNHGPAVAVVLPLAGELFYGEQSVAFTARANDLEDGALTGTNLVWRSDRDGLLGDGDVLLREVRTLAEGAHLITVTATDSGGLTNAATVVINISHDEPPRLNIERLLPDVVLSWPVAATNYHLQRAVSLPGGWSNVTNAPQAVDDKWQVTLPASGAEKFFRLIKP